MKDKIIEFLDKSVSSEIILKRIAFYLLLICILLGLIFFKLNEINKNILLATEPIISAYNNEKEEKKYRTGVSFEIKNIEQRVGDAVQDGEVLRVYTTQKRFLATAKIVLLNENTVRLKTDKFFDCEEVMCFE